MTSISHPKAIVIHRPGILGKTFLGTYSVYQVGEYGVIDIVVIYNDILEPEPLEAQVWHEMRLTAPSWSFKAEEIISVSNEPIVAAMMQMGMISPHADIPGHPRSVQPQDVAALTAYLMAPECPVEIRETFRRIGAEMQAVAAAARSYLNYHPADRHAGGSANARAWRLLFQEARTAEQIFEQVATIYQEAARIGVQARKVPATPE